MGLGEHPSHVLPQNLEVTNDSQVVRTLNYSTLASDSAGMPTKKSEDGEAIHFSELETILTMVANNPEKIGSRTCMTSGAIKSVDNAAVRASPVPEGSRSPWP